MVTRLIENDGTVDGINLPNALGVKRLALDLKEAREMWGRLRKIALKLENELAFSERSDLPMAKRVREELLNELLKYERSWEELRNR